MTTIIAHLRSFSASPSTRLTILSAVLIAALCVVANAQLSQLTASGNVRKQIGAADPYVGTAIEAVKSTDRLAFLGRFELLKAKKTATGNGTIVAGEIEGRFNVSRFYAGGGLDVRRLIYSLEDKTGTALFAAGGYHHEGAQYETFAGVRFIGDDHTPNHSKGVQGRVDQYIYPKESKWVFKVSADIGRFTYNNWDETRRHSGIAAGFSLGAGRRF